MGMISNPSVLFLDEPTTGLDSAAAFSIVKHLVELAESMNVAVIMTIHQPAEMVFDMLQVSSCLTHWCNVLLLQTKDSLTIYHLLSVFVCVFRTCISSKRVV
jgi:ABC-type Mn2+/Zn2+ transport system ATPase subunit